MPVGLQEDPQRRCRGYLLCMVRKVTRRQLAVDISLAALFTAMGLIQLFVPNDDGIYAGPPALNVLLTLVLTSALAFRRIWPIGAAVVALAAQVLPTPFVATSSSFWGMAVPAAILVFGAARWGTLRPALGVAALPLVLFPLSAIHVTEYRSWSEQVFPVLMLGAVWAAGRVINRLDGQRHKLDAALSQIAEQQQELSRQAVLAERSRIAREMHDVVAHGVSVMIVQAGSARVKLPDGADAPRESLLAVEGTGREVLGELRRVVSLLRHDEQLATEPSPGLADLPSLTDSMRSAGLDVTLDLPAGTHADPGRELAIYRVVQEGLTNALRHSGRTRVYVRVSLNGGSLCVNVVDAGPRSGHYGPPGIGGGHGLLGLRERIAAYGGRFEAGQQDSGFAVSAGIPLDLR